MYIGLTVGSMRIYIRIMQCKNLYQRSRKLLLTIDDNDKHYILGPPKWNLRF